MSLKEAIVYAASALHQRNGGTAFSAEALVVEAWMSDRRMFGLQGYEGQYPDANKVLSYLMGEKGLVKQGLLVRVSTKMYHLSTMGQEVVRRMNWHVPVVVPRITIQWRLTLRDEQLLLRLLHDRAYTLLSCNSDLSQLGKADAHVFWSGHDKASVADLKNVDSFLPRIVTEYGTGATSLRLSNGREVELLEVQKLADCHQKLMRRYGVTVNRA